MLISHNHKFIFLHNPKTGGTSIQQALLPYLDFPETEEEKGLGTGPVWFGPHRAFRFVPRHMRPRFKDYMKFTFVRNPWVRAVSYFLMEKRHGVIRVTQSFKSYMMRDYRHRGIRLQARYAQGCDFIGKFENLQSDFDGVCEMIGLPQMDLPRLNENETSAEEVYRRFYVDGEHKYLANLLESDANQLRKYGVKYVF